MKTGDIVALSAFILTVFGLIFTFAKGFGKLSGKVDGMSDNMKTFIKKHDENCPAENGTINEISMKIVRLDTHGDTCPARNGTINKLRESVTDLTVQVAKLNGGPNAKV